MKIGYIGAGKVGQSIGLLMFSKGVQISGYYSKTKQSAQDASKRFAGVAFDTLKQLVIASDIIGITVNDDQINQVVDDISKLNHNLEEKLFFHMSGAHDATYLKKICSNAFSLHPLRAFPEVVTSPEAFDDTYFSLEGANDYVREWVNQLNLLHFEIRSNQKAQYHSAAVIVSNYLISVLDFGFKQFKDIGLSDALIMKSLWPLITNTIQNVEKFGSTNALTGPIVRGDIETIQRHLDVLDPSSKHLYKALGQYTLSMTQHDGKLRQQLSALFEEVEYGKSNDDDIL